MFSVVTHSTRRVVNCRSHLGIQGVYAARKACYSDGMKFNEGPLQLYKSYLERKVLKPDNSQLKVVCNLQSLFERLKDYDSQKQSSKSIAQSYVGFIVC